MTIRLTLCDANVTQQTDRQTKGMGDRPVRIAADMTATELIILYVTERAVNRCTG